VDVRHDVTHLQLASLGLLRDAAAASLDWLHREYWEPTAASMQLRWTEARGLLHDMLLSPEGVALEACQQALARLCPAAGLW
jgi:hypothetical protein